MGLKPRASARPLEQHQHRLGLTGPESHVVRIEPGTGNFYIGPDQQPRGVPQAIVDPGTPIDWSAIEALETGGAYAWPRRLVYEGDELGVFEWAKRRPIETLEWTPTSATTVDASGSQIGSLSVVLDRFPVAISLPANVRLFVSGRPEMLEPSAANGGRDIDLGFTGLFARASVVFYPSLADATSLYVHTDKRPADGASIARYSGLRDLSIHGGVGAAEELAALTELESIEFRESWDLSALPPLSSWPRLSRFFAANIAAADGKRLEAEIKALAGVDGTVRKKRTPEWIASNADSPFKNWSKKSRELATAAYREAEAAIANRAGKAAVLSAVASLVAALNAIHGEHGLETAEREDAAFAVWRLTSATGLADDSIERFDRDRRF